MPIVYFVIGVSGSGKTSVGQLLAQQTDLPFFDADDFHSSENKEKMKNGIPLNDEDRAGWLNSLNELVLKHAVADGAVLACSALKEKYRQVLMRNLKCSVHWIVLKGDYDLIYNRMELRKDHYMPPGLLTSQLETMEYPSYGIPIDIHLSPDQIIKHVLHNQNLSEFGLMGLGVMGKSLARNLASKGIRLSLFNQHTEGKEEKVAEKTIQFYPEFLAAKGFDQIAGFVQSLSLPRKIFLMVPAGNTVDLVIENLMPHLSPGDIIMDGGNSHFKDTERRQTELIKAGIHFIGIGVSGGELGALVGPAIMPGGNRRAYESVQDILNAIAAKDKNNKPCCSLIGSGGAGHFVKMIHNGIEYAEMQLISEVYWILKKGMHQSNESIAQLFEKWYDSDLSSYLLEITIKILRHKTGDQFTLDTIADIGGSKGTGGWSLTAASDLGTPATMVADALFARYISGTKTERLQNSTSIPVVHELMHLELNDLHQAYSMARWINHHQGFEIIRAASNQYGWNLNLAETARVWTSGCIIRSTMIETICDLFKSNTNIVATKISMLAEQRPSLIRCVSAALINGLAIPCLSAALNYILGYTSADSPMNLIQAQRDFFGAHTYKKIDDPFGKSYHTDWING